MGGRSSKVQETAQRTARQVLAKRTPPPVSAAVAEAASEGSTVKGAVGVTNSVDVASAPVSAPQQKAPDDLIDSHILKDMSKWDFVRTTEVLAPTSEHSSGLASMVRHREEKKLLAEKGYMGQLPHRLQGRLTEADIINIYRVLRDDRATLNFENIAKEFHVTKEAIETLDRVARVPTFVAENSIDKVGR